MVVLRRELGELLRERRKAQRKTLRQVSHAACCGLGYLSEIERGTKEASSEVLWRLCEALDLSLAEVLSELSMRVGTLESLTAPTDVSAA